MIQNYIGYQILQLFFDSPTKQFQLREISRLVDLGLPSVKNYVSLLEKADLVKREKRGLYWSYGASNNESFRIYKRNDILLRLHESGLLSYLEDECVPDAIILFGSASRGEDRETSDVDLFILSEEKEFRLKKYEEKLKRKISLHFEKSISKIPKELRNNVLNGIVLRGYVTVFQ